jgi:lipopolysaccharide biosynthesis glycosyltransferase
MTKLQTFKLVEYEKVIFLDSDIIMVSPADAVFEIEGFGGGSGNFGSEGLFNAGYMLIEPSKKTFKRLLKLTTRAPPTLFDNILDCTEMGLLNQFYHKRLSLLPMASPYNVVKSPFVHWYGDHKPWENLDTTCYPSPYFSNKLWAQNWEDTVEAMKDFTGHELFQKAHKAVMDKRGVPSMIHTDKSPASDKQNKDKTQSDAGGYPYLSGSPYAYLEEEERAQYSFSYPYLEEHAQSRSSSPYFEESAEYQFQYASEKTDNKIAPYLEGFQYAEEKSFFQYAEEKSFFQYAEEKSFFQYAEERSYNKAIRVVGK